MGYRRLSSPGVTGPSPMMHLISHGGLDLAGNGVLTTQVSGKVFSRDKQVPFQTKGKVFGRHWEEKADTFEDEVLVCVVCTITVTSGPGHLLNRISDSKSSSRRSFKTITSTCCYTIHS